MVSKMIDFSEALIRMKGGARVQRSGWNGKGMWIQYIKRVSWAVAGVDDLPVLPFIGMKTADNHFVPWLASQTDILAEDWIVL